MSELKRKEFGERFQGKTGDPIIRGGVDFRFPFSAFLPEPTKKERVRLIDDIGKVGIRKPISVRILPFAADDAEAAQGRVIPPVKLKIEGERLIKVRSPALTEGQEHDPNSQPEATALISDSYELTKGVDGEILPIVLVIDGELRLRAAEQLEIPLEEIPFREYIQPPRERADQFKALLSNAEERRKFDELPKHSRVKCAFILDLWKTSTTRRGGLSSRGYGDMICWIDKMFHGQFKRMSLRKMGNLLGIGRNHVRNLRREGAKEQMSPADCAAANRLDRLKQERHDISSNLNKLIRAFEELQRIHGDKPTDEFLGDLKHTGKLALEHHDQQIEDLSAKLNAAFDEAYERAIAESYGPFDGIIQVEETLPEAMDKVIANEMLCHISSTSWDDLVTFEEPNIEEGAGE